MYNYYYIILLLLLTFLCSVYFSFFQFLYDINMVGQINTTVNVVGNFFFCKFTKLFVNAIE